MVGMKKSILIFLFFSLVLIDVNAQEAKLNQSFLFKKWYLDVDESKDALSVFSKYELKKFSVCPYRYCVIEFFPEGQFCYYVSGKPVFGKYKIHKSFIKLSFGSYSEHYMVKDLNNESLSLVLTGKSAEE